MDIIQIMHVGEEKGWENRKMKVNLEVCVPSISVKVALKEERNRVLEL